MTESSRWALIFDFDGLILDTETSEYLTVAEAFADHGLQLDRSEWSAVIGSAAHPHWADMLETALGRPLSDREAVMERRRERHHALISREQVRPGVLSLLDEAEAAEVPCAVASSSSLDWVGGHCERLGIRERFAVVVTRDDVGRERTKPEPDLFLHAAERLGTPVGAAVVLEDSPNGVAAAVAAGTPVVAVAAGMTADADLSAADLVVASLAEVDLACLGALTDDASDRPTPR